MWILHQDRYVQDVRASYSEGIYLNLLSVGHIDEVYGQKGRFSSLLTDRRYLWSQIMIFQLYNTLDSEEGVFTHSHNPTLHSGDISNDHIQTSRCTAILHRHNLVRRNYLINPQISFQQKGVSIISLVKYPRFYRIFRFVYNSTDTKHKCLMIIYTKHHTLKNNIVQKHF